MYRERPSRIAGAYAWTSRVDDDEIRVLPDGCIDLIWNDGDFFVAGPDTRAQLFHGVPGSRLAAVRFAPGFGPRVLGTPAVELRDQRVPVADVWDAAHTQQAIDRLAESDDPTSVLEDLAIERAGYGGVDRLVGGVVTLARRGETVAAIADQVGLSDRQLQRRCLDAFGYGAKTLARILRMSRALTLARAGHGFADTAVTAGYADQAHLARDIKQLTGRTLGELIS